MADAIGLSDVEDDGNLTRAVSEDFAGQAVSVYDELALPLVTFIITNYNYGRFLRQCVDSIFAQDYPRFELVIIDNASTDESADVLKCLAASYPDLRIVRNIENLGQTIAGRQGFRITSGQFVSFIDADDYILPDYAKSHVVAHLSVVDACAFSSADMIEMVDDSIRATTVMNGAIRKSFSRDLRPDEYSGLKLQGLWRRLQLSEELKLRIVHPDNIHWIWAPTTGSMYRRDALDLFIENGDIAKLKLSMDAYFNFALNALCGSVLIERPLSVYRIHGRNNFAKAGQMRNLMNFDQTADFGCFAAYCALEHMVKNYHLFDDRVFSLSHLLRTMRTLAHKSKSQSGVSLAVRRSLQPWIKLVWTLILKRILPFRH